MHIMSRGSDGRVRGWNRVDQIPVDHVRLTEAEIEAIVNPPRVIDGAAIAARRYDAEIAGVVIDGMWIDTGRDSQALITGAALQATITPDYSVRWKTGGGFIELNAQQIISLASAVRAHVQACFDREAELLAELEAGTFTEAMLDQGWPVPQSS